MTSREYLKLFVRFLNTCCVIAGIIAFKQNNWPVFYVWACAYGLTLLWFYHLHPPEA